MVHPMVDGKPDYSKVVSCRCIAEKLDRERRQRIMAMCELPVETEHMTFEKWEPRAGLEEAYNSALVLADGETKDNWLTFMSDTNRGKTHLLIAVCRRWLTRGIPARYAYVPLLMEELKRGFRREEDYTYESRFDFFLNVPLLALDDLGVENRTPWVQEKLDTIIDYRLVNGLALVVTTNQPWDEMPFRIKSRLERRGKVIFIDAPEYGSEENEPAASV